MKYKLKYVEDLSLGDIVHHCNMFLLLVEKHPFWKQQTYDMKLCWRLRFLNGDRNIYNMLRVDGDTLEVISSPPK